MCKISRILSYTRKRILWISGCFFISCSLYYWEQCVWKTDYHRSMFDNIFFKFYRYKSTTSDIRIIVLFLSSRNPFLSSCFLLEWDYFQINRHPFTSSSGLLLIGLATEVKKLGISGWLNRKGEGMQHFHSTIKLGVCDICETLHIV